MKYTNKIYDETCNESYITMKRWPVIAFYDYIVILKTNHIVLWIYLGVLKTNHTVLYLGILSIKA